MTNLNPPLIHPKQN